MVKDKTVISDCRAFKVTRREFIAENQRVKTFGCTCKLDRTSQDKGAYYKIVTYLRWMIPPMVVHPEKIDFRRFV